MKWMFPKIREPSVLSSVLSVFAKPGVGIQRVISSLVYTEDLKLPSFTVELYLKSSQLLIMNLFD